MKRKYCGKCGHEMVAMTDKWYCVRCKTQEDIVKYAKARKFNIKLSETDDSTKIDLPTTD